MSAGLLVPEQSWNRRLVAHAELTEIYSNTERQDNAIEQIEPTLTCKLAPLHT